MEREAEELPITITPDVNCYWRWVSAQELACNLEAKDYLKPGAGLPGSATRTLRYADE